MKPVVHKLIWLQSTCKVRYHTWESDWKTANVKNQVKLLFRKIIICIILILQKGYIYIYIYIYIYKTRERDRESKPDTAQLCVRRNLWRYIVGGAKSKCCIIGNFCSQTLTDTKWGWRLYWGGGAVSQFGCKQISLLKSKDKFLILLSTMNPRPRPPNVDAASTCPLHLTLPCTEINAGN